MKFIYFVGGFGDNQEEFKNLVQDINRTSSQIVIYGGNHNLDKLCNNLLGINDTLNIIDSELNNDASKIVMFGNADVSNINLPLELEFYSRHDKFQIFNNVVSFSDSKNLIIMFDSMIFNIEKPSETLVINTWCINFFSDFAKNENKDKNKTIKDLIDWQFSKILQILNSNLNRKNLIFITSNPLTDKMKLFYQWINEYHSMLSNYSIYWLCGSKKSSSGKIIIKNNENQTKMLEISQYVLAGETNNTNENEIFPNEIIEVRSEYTDEITKLELEFYINSHYNKIGYFAYDTENNPYEKIKYIELKEPEGLEESEEPEGLKEPEKMEEPKKLNVNIDQNKTFTQIKSKYGKGITKKILNHIEISGGESDNDNDSDNLDSDKDDPYRIKYLKYKAKLIELRKSKANKANK